MAENKKRIYEATTLGVPALKMVLVHARNDAQNAGLRSAPASVQPGSTEETEMNKEQAVRRIIRHLEASREQ